MNFNNTPLMKVIDSNFLQSKDLEMYLSKSKLNHIVLTDYVAMEAYKEETLKSLYKSFKIISNYPKQVIVLKSTTKVCRMSGRTAGLRRRLIDLDQTRNFHKFCQQLARAKAGDISVQKKLLDRGVEANSHMENILLDVEPLAAHIEEFSASFTKNELNIIRKGHFMSETLVNKIIEAIKTASLFMFANRPDVKYPDQAEAFVNTFIFRWAFIFNVFMLEFLSVGGKSNIKAAKMRNHMVDLIFACYATFFDGLLTHDRKLQNIYTKLIFYLRNIIYIKGKS